jgi:hypothetical protein
LFLDAIARPQSAGSVAITATIKFVGDFSSIASKLSHPFNYSQNLQLSFIDDKLVVFAAAFAVWDAAVNFAGPFTFNPSRFGKSKRVAVVRLRVTRRAKRNGCPPSF